jgi:ketosteroid isomerase-like protein
MRIHHLALGAVVALVSLTATAGPAEDAEGHFSAVAKGNVDAVMAAYGDGAVFQWIGGPLDGVYTGSEAIRGVWSKFAKGNAPLEVTVDDLKTSANPKGATVTANVLFKGSKAIKVRYVLTYRESKLVNEVWQIDPKLDMGY